MRKFLFAIISFCTGAFSASAHQLDFGIDSVSLRLDQQRYLYPQEKVHLTTNQGSYVAGDTIWFRAWVVDAASHRQVAISRYVYAELISPFGSIDSRVKIKEHDGVYQGYIALPEDMPEGTYTLSAYTGFMESAGADYFFRKPLPVISPYSAKSAMVTEFSRNGDNLLLTVGLTDPTGADLPYSNMTITSANGTESNRGHGKGRKGIRLNARERDGGVVLVRIDNYSKYIPLPPAESSICVTFHPEGGYLIPGEASRLGIKAIDKSGRGVDVTGRIIDSKGIEVGRFATIHRGMGETVFVPQPGETYTAEVNGLKFELPATNASAAVLRVDNSRAATMNVSAIGNLPVGATLIAQNRGRAIYCTPVERGVTYRLPRNRMGAGIVQFLLVDGNGEPLSERLAFVYPDSTLTAPLKASVTSDPDGRFRLSVTLPDTLADGDVAVSIVDRSLAEHDASTDISTQLLLQSDLRGHIEDPGYYFRKRDRATTAALDALLLTQGWSRYDLPATLQRRYSEPSAFLEQGMEITGIIKSRWKGKPLTGAQINILGPKAGYAGLAVTDANGRFTVNDVEWLEGVKFVVQALDKKGRNEHNFEIDPEHFPDVRPLMPQFVPTPELAAGSQFVDAERMRRISRINGWLNVALGEVTVNWRQRKKPEDIYEVLASRTFRTEDIEKEHITTYDELLRKIPGLIIDNGQLYYRREPVEFWVDGVRWGLSKTDLNDIPLNTQKRPSVQAEMNVINGSFKSNLQPIQTSNSIMSQWQKKPSVNINDFKYQYPFDIVKRIDVIQPSMSAIFTSSGYAVFNIITKEGSEIAHSNDWQYQIIEPLGYQKRKEFYNPKYNFSTDNEIEGRSTIYWNPQTSINELIGQQLALPSANIAILIEGILPDGTTIQCHH